jgi:hypothetical protein
LLDRKRIDWWIVKGISLIWIALMADVSTKTLLAAMGLLDNQEMNATVFNRRFELIIKMIRGEVNDDDLRRYITEFETERKSLDYLLDPETGEIGTYEQYRKSLF